METGNKKSFFKPENKWDYIKIVAAVLAVTLVFVIVTAAALSTRDVFSDDFNSGKHDFETEYKKADSTVFSISPSYGMDESGCLVIENSAQSDASYTRDIYLQARRHYRVTGYVRTENINGSGAVGASVQVNKMSKGSGKTDETIFASQNAYVTGGAWTKVVIDLPETDMSHTYQLVLRLGGEENGATAGKAYFDNITVEKISALDEGTFDDVRILSCIIVVLMLFVFFVAYSYSKKYEINDGKSILAQPAGGAFNVTTAAVILFAAALMLRIFLSVTYYQCDIDVNLFKSWGDVAYNAGLTNVYTELGANIDYPPIVVYFLWFASAIEKNFGNFFGLGHEYLHTIFVKLPSILCDMAIGYVIYKYAKKYGASTEWSLFFTALWLFNPLSLIDASCWGQVDSMLTLAVILSIIYLNKKKHLTAGIWFGVGVVLKPQMFFFLPVFGYMWLKDVIEDKNAMKAVKTFFASVGGALAGVIIPCIPYLHMGFEKITLFGKGVKVPWIFSLFVGTANHYEYASVNSYNFWFMAGKNWVEDKVTLLEAAKSAEKPSQLWISILSKTPFGDISLFAIGITFIVIISLVTLLFAVRLKKGEHLPYLLSAFMFAAVPFFAPRMHERYFFPALALLIIALVIYNKQLMLLPVGLLSASGFLIVTDVLMGLSVGGNLKNLGKEYDVYSDYYWPAHASIPDRYRMLLSFLMLFAVITILAIMIFAELEEKCKTDILGGKIYNEIIKEKSSAQEIVPENYENIENVVETATVSEQRKGGEKQ